MATKAYKKPAGSPRSSLTTVGEIDTRAPFQSVRAAVSLFGEGSVSHKEKSPIRITRSPTDLNRAVDKETQLHLAENELNKLKEKIKNAENKKSRAQHDLNLSKGTLQEVSSELDTVTESKNLAMEEMKTAKKHAKKLEEAQLQEPNRVETPLIQSLRDEEEEYKRVGEEVSTAKQKLRKLQQNFDSLLEDKVFAFQKAADAQHALKTNRKRAGELTKDITAMQESISHLNQATNEAEEERYKIAMENDELQRSHATVMKETNQQLTSLRNSAEQISPDLEKKLSETNAEIEHLRNKIQSTMEADLSSAIAMRQELDGEKLALQQITIKEESLNHAIRSLQLELDEVNEGHASATEKVTELESRAAALSADVEEKKADLQRTVLEGEKDSEERHEMTEKLEQMSMESRSAREEKRSVQTAIEDIEKEADAFRDTVNNTEEKLVVARREAGEAREVERLALDKMKADGCFENSDMGTGAKISVSSKEIESLMHKAEESDDAADLKVAAALVDIKRIEHNKDEATKKVEEFRRETETARAATEEALKQANSADAAKKMVENELKKWRDEELRGR